MNSDPKLPGTDIPIYAISALIDGGMTVEEIQEDFPSLSHAQITYATRFAVHNPPPAGVIYPKHCVKRLLRTGVFTPKQISVVKR